MSLYRILCTTAPAWLVGEDEKDAIPRREGLDASVAADRYLDDFSGQILAAIPYTRRYSAEVLARPHWREVVLDLSNADLASARSCKYKMPSGTAALADVTFGDKYGATAAGLLRFDATASVTSEDDEQDAIQVVRDANDWTQTLYEGAIEQWKYDYPIAFILGTPLPDKPTAPVLAVVPEPVFGLEVTRLRRKLEPTIVHSGAGLYEVGPAKTYATWTLALAALWVDQGATAFAANQYIRGFADTYVEQLLPNASLNPDETLARTLIIEGDPDDVRANIVIAPAAGTYSLFVGCDHAHVRHLTISGVATNQEVGANTGCVRLNVSDCVITANGAANAIKTSYGLVAEDSILIVTSNTHAGLYCNSDRTLPVIRRCQIVGPGKTTSTAQGIRVDINGLEVEGCTIRGFGVGIQSPSGTILQNVRVANNNIYSCVSGIRLVGALDVPIVSINNIFKDNTYNYRTSAWPEEGAAVLGPIVTQRNNYFHGYTNFAYDGTTTKTFAEWNAFNRVDNAGDVDGVDPLLTSPGTGDFSLQASSPCRNTGQGSGVIKGYNDVAFDANEPDVGAWSSGEVAATSAPTWSSNLSNITATDAAADSEVDLTWDAASQAQSKNIGYIAEYRTTAGPGSWTEAERSNDTSLTVSGLTNDTGYDFRVKAYARVETEPTTTPSDTASATPTRTAAPSQITIAATDQEDGDSIVVAVTGATGVTARVYYRLRGQDDWLGSSEREGNGNVTFTGLFSGNEYAFSGVGVSDGIVSIPSDPAFAWCTSGDAIRAEIRVALGQRLYLDSTLANLISSRVFYVRPPQAIEYPCVTYHVSEDNPQMLIDEYGKVDFMIQIDIWSQGDDKIETLDKIVDAIDNLLTDWRVDTTNWLGLRLRRTAGPLRVELKGKQQRAMMWALTAGRKGT